MSSPNLAREISLLAVLATLWGSSYLFIKVAVAEIPPLTLIAARVSIAAVFLSIVLALRHEHLPRSPAAWRRLLLLAFFNSIGAWTVLAWGQQFVDSGLASVLNSTAPVFVFFATAFITRHETTDLFKLAGAGFGLCGILLIVGTEALAGLGQQIAGQAAVLSGAMLYAAAAIYSRRLTQLPAPMSAPATATGTMICASICLVPLSLAIDRPWNLNPSPTALAALLALSVFSTGVALLIYFRLIRTLGSLGTTSQSYLRAVVGVALGVVILGERVDPTVGLGLFACIVGVALINLPRTA